MSSNLEQLALMIDETWATREVECNKCPHWDIARFCSDSDHVTPCPRVPAPLDTPELIARVAVWALKSGRILHWQYEEAVGMLIREESVEISSRMAFEYICEQIHAAAAGEGK